MGKGVRGEKEDVKMVPYGSNRSAGQGSTGKIVREKWSNNNQKLDPRQKSFTPEEEDLVIQLHAAIGSRWPIIAQQLVGKTDKDVKILWNSKLRKRLSSMGIDPVTHKPFSQILADYRDIGALPKARTRLSSLSKDLKNTLIFNKSERTQKSSQIGLYSQLQEVSFRTKAKECVSSSLAANQESSGFSWADFFLEDPFPGLEMSWQENEVALSEFDECVEGRGKAGPVDDKNDGYFDGPSSSNGSCFVETMLENQDAMFSQLACLSEEPFYY